MVAVPVSPCSPLPEAGKAAGFHGSSGRGFWKLKARVDVGDEPGRVSLEISGVFPALAAPAPPAPALPWLGLLKGRKDELQVLGK